MADQRRRSPQRQWEQALIDAYYDHRWRQVLDPLYDKFQRWKAGDLTHDDIDHAIHQTHRQTQQLFSLFTTKRDLLARMIQMDTDWFETWTRDHPPPEPEQPC